MIYGHVLSIPFSSFTLAWSNPFDKPMQEYKPLKELEGLVYCDVYFDLNYTRAMHFYC